MRYRSTRSVDTADAKARTFTFQEAVLTGIADDGGLFMPIAIPNVTARLNAWSHLSFHDLAFEILSLYVDTKTDIPAADLKALIGKAYAPELWSDAEIAPVVRVGDALYVSELWHGPTLAFKDIAMQFIGHLLEYYLAREKKRVTLVISTSGDTGPAAIHAVKGKASAECYVLFPTGMVSQRQAKQMTAVADANVHVYSVAGSSDDMDIVVKNLNADLAFKKANNLCSINSFNWARICLQTIHFFYSYFKVKPNCDGAVNFALPTGALGNGIAGVVALQMGLPIHRLVYATNENDVLARLFKTGVYEKPATLTPTISPAIDIQVPYNVERAFYFMAKGDTRLVAQWMADFERTHRCVVPSQYRQHLATHILAERSDQRETFEAIQRCYKYTRYVMDPHTAVGLCGAEKALKFTAFALTRAAGAPAPLHPTVLLSTAHPSKFEATIKRAIGFEAHVPDSMQQLLTGADHHTLVPKHDVAGFEAALRATIVAHVKRGNPLAPAKGAAAAGAGAGAAAAAAAKPRSKL